jgi:curved DNA-binding protein CbpA
VHEDHYAVLGVDETVDPRTLRAAYLARMRLHHPDRRPGDPGDMARRLNAAYAVLKDPVRRAAYDRTRRTSQLRHRPAGVNGVQPRRSTTGHAPRGARTVDNPAYSPDYLRNYHLVSTALWRLGLAVFVVGVLVLAALAT